jgi:acyl-CoA reductase-like NAD-dependent aldehyde dehydrogenase
VTTAVERPRVDVAGVPVSPDHFIGGRRVAGREAFVDRSPIDEAVLAEVARGGPEEVDQAVQAAQAAFPAWAALGPARRAERLHRLADLIDERVEPIAAIECADMAMLERSLRARVVPRGARNFRSYADLAAGYREREWSSNGTENRVIRMPAGPVAIITPWNAPFMLSTWKCAPALAAGCTVVLKPPEWAPLSCSLLADLTDEAGLPAGVLNVVQGIGEEAGAALVSHPGVRRVSFTGSTETARSIGRSTAENIVPFTAELGGKSPLVVFADADLDAAAAKAAGQYDDSGQNCMAGTRLLVEEAIAEDFLARFHAEVDRHVLGDPRDERTTISPLIHRDHLARVAGFVERARQNGDRIVRGGAGGRAGRPLVRAHADRAALERERGRPARGVRAGAHAPDVRRRARGALARELDRLRARGDRVHRLARARRAGRPRHPRRHGVGELLPRPRLDGAVRRHAPVGDRPRGRRLRPRLLLRPEDPPDPRGHHAVVGRRGQPDAIDAWASSR